MILIDFETEMVGDYGDPVPMPLEVTTGYVTLDGPQVQVSLQTWEIVEVREILPRPEQFALTRGVYPKVKLGDLRSTLEVAAGPANFQKQLWAWPASFECSVMVTIGALPRMSCLWSYARGGLGLGPYDRLGLQEAADRLGVEYDKGRLHGSAYDVWLMAQVFNRVRNRYALE